MWTWCASCAAIFDHMRMMEQTIDQRRDGGGLRMPKSSMINSGTVAGRPRACIALRWRDPRASAYRTSRAAGIA